MRCQKSAGQKGAVTKVRKTKKRMTNGRKTEGRKSIRITRITIFHNILSPCISPIMNSMILKKVSSVFIFTYFKHCIFLLSGRETSG